MQTIPAPVARLRDVFPAAWIAYRANLLAIVVLVLVIDLPIDAIMEQVPLSDEPTPKEIGRYFRILRALEFWFGTIRDLGIIHLTVASFRGEALSVGQTFSAAFEDYGRALWALFVSGLVLLGGLLLLVLPGLAAFIYLAFVVQVIVAEGETGREAVSASYRFVKGRWWPFCFRVVILTVLMFSTSALLSLIIGMVLEVPDVQFVTLIPVNLVLAYFVVCFTSLYLMSGPDTESVQDALDPTI